MGLLRTLVGGAVVGGVAVFAGVGALDDETTRGAGGEIVESGGVGAFVLRIGDCVQWPEDDADGVTSVEGVPCGEPHDAEVYAKYDLDLPEFDEAAVETDGGDGCLDRWQQAIGTVWEDDPDLDLATFFPSSDSWSAGDREVVCFVVAIDGERLVGSRRL